MARLAAALPEKVLAQIGHRPQAYFADMRDLMAGYGALDRIDAAAIGVHIHIRRASYRADAIRMLTLADLDDDRAVRDSEFRTVLAQLSPGLRTRLARMYAEADTDLSGDLDAAEFAAYPAAYALGRLDRDDEAALMSVMAFDADHDGSATLDEVQAGLSLLTPYLAEVEAQNAKVGWL